VDVFIINKEAGNNSLKYLRSLEEIYRSSGEEYKVVYPTDEKDTVQKAFYYATKTEVRYIFAIGGDGTVNRVVNGMVYGNKPLVVIPSGSGNDFYRGISKFDKDIKIDLGQVNDEYFLGILSIGVDALVAKRANELKKSGYQGNSYVKSALELLQTYNAIELTTKYNNKEINKNVTMLSICNNGIYGQGINLIPHASLSDGMFDVCMIDDMANIRLLYLFSKLLMGKHLNDKCVKVFKTNKIDVNFLKQMIYSFDGEIRYADSLKVVNKPSKLLVKRQLNPSIIKLCKEYVKK